MTRATRSTPVHVTSLRLDSPTREWIGSYADEFGLSVNAAIVKLCIKSLSDWEIEREVKIPGSRIKAGYVCKDAS